MIKIVELFEDREETLELEPIEIGDEILVGKFKNRKATVKGFDTDKHNQPVLKTTKGDQKLFKPRIKKLEETFDKSYNYSWESTGPGAWYGDFKTDGGDIINVTIENRRSIWNVEFNRNGDATITGDGDALRIFSTVLAMIDEFNDVEYPDTISFSATKVNGNESRHKLYTRMISRFAGELGFTSTETIRDNIMYFVLIRDDNNVIDETATRDDDIQHILSMVERMK